MDHLSVEGISWELSVLAKAVAYKNLSGAASNIGISQPQLSRIVGKLERELSGVLLDRGSRRKSAWTPLAHRLAEVYVKSIHGLDADLQKLLEGSEPKLLRIGTLEGLIPLAAAMGNQIFCETGVGTIELNVYDLHQLEERFFKSDLDLVFTVREPGRKKYAYNRLLGYQDLELIETSRGVRVVSSYEFGAAGSKTKRRMRRQAEPGELSAASAPARILISNSLMVRRQWLEGFGGVGTMPGEVRPSRKAAGKSVGRMIEEQEVHLFAQDSFSSVLWKKIVSFRSG